MKFFFNFSELGSCCRPQATPAEFPALTPDEGGGCASGAHAPSKRSGKCSASGQWRPGLPAISEDGAAAVRAALEKSRQAARRRPPERVVGSTAAKKRSYNSGGSKEEFRTNSTPVIIPAFSPTPFMF